MRRLAVTFGLALAAALGVPGTVTAQTADYPGGPAPQVQGVTVESGEPSVAGLGSERAAPAAAAQAGRAGRFPVTGADLAQLATLGVALTAGGAVLVRRSRRRDGTSMPPPAS